MTKNCNPALAVVIALGSYLLVTSAFYPIESLSVFDAKRILQLVLFCAVLIFASTWAPLRVATITQLIRVPLPVGFALALFFLIGVVSSLRLEHPAYALIDVSMLFVMLILIVVVAGSRNLSNQRFDKWAILLLAGMGLAVVIQELMGFIANWVLGTEFSYSHALIHFAHPRFYNQLQTWSIPVLAAIPLLFPGNRWIRLGCIVLLGLQWFLVIAYAARGTAASLAMAMVFVALWCRGQRKYWLNYQLAGLAAGVIFYVGILQLNGLLIPQAQSGEFYAQSAGRPLLHTTGRNMLWRLSIKDVSRNPLLGAGPSHYACDNQSDLPAHSHSFPLQIMGEWGLIAFILMLAVATIVGFNLLTGLRQQQNSHQTGPPLKAMLAISLVAGIIHSCVSGLLIMPASQVAVILIAGWALGLFRKPEEHQNINLVPKTVLLTGVVIICTLLTFAIHEVPNIEARTGYFDNDKLLGPRFWQDGRTCDYIFD